MAQKKQVPSSRPGVDDTPEFWQYMERRFRRIPECESDAEGLRVYRRPPNKAGEHWFFHPGNDQIRELFLRSVKRATLALGYSGNDFLSFWLDRLKQDNPHLCRQYSVGLQENGKREDYEGEIVMRVCEASADYCQQLQNEAVARQQNIHRPEYAQCTKRPRGRPEKTIVQDRRTKIRELREAGYSGRPLAVKLHERGVPVPISWKERDRLSNWVRVYDNPDTCQLFHNEIYNATMRKPLTRKK